MANFFTTIMDFLKDLFSSLSGSNGSSVLAIIADFFGRFGSKEEQPTE